MFSICNHQTHPFWARNCRPRSWHLPRRSPGHPPSAPRSPGSYECQWAAHISPRLWPQRSRKKNRKRLAFEKPKKNRFGGHFFCKSYVFLFGSVEWIWYDDMIEEWWMRMVFVSWFYRVATGNEIVVHAMWVCISMPFVSIIHHVMSASWLGSMLLDMLEGKFTQSCTCYY